VGGLNVMSFDMGFQIAFLIQANVVDGIADTAAKMGVGAEIGVVSRDSGINCDLQNYACLSQGL